MVLTVRVKSVPIDCVRKRENPKTKWELELAALNLEFSLTISNDLDS